MERKPTLRMPSGKTPDETVTELNNFLAENPDYAMDLMRVIELTTIINRQLFAHIHQSAKKNRQITELLKD